MTWLPLRSLMRVTTPGLSASVASATCSGVRSVSTSFCTARVPWVLSATDTSSGTPSPSLDPSDEEGLATAGFFSSSFFSSEASLSAASASLSFSESESFSPRTLATARSIPIRCSSLQHSSSFCTR